jgi:Zn-finger protein
MRISQWSKTDTRWYLGVLCHQCQTPILFALDRSDGEIQPAAPGKLVLTCVKAECRHRSDYSTAAVSRFQKDPLPQNETRSQ